MSSLVDTDTARQLSAKFRELSPSLARACEHLGSAMRNSYLKLFEAIHGGDMVSAARIMEEIQKSELVVGVAAKFHDVREKVQALRDDLAPFAQTVLGLTMVVAGAFLFGEVAILATLLMIGGFLIAISGLPKQMMDRVAK